MKSLAKILINITGLCIAASFSCSAFAKHHKSAAVYSQPIYGAEGLTNAMDQAINSIDPNLSIGVAVKSMKTGQVLYTRNPHQLFVPASVLKVFTAEAALLYLGSDYKFQTSFYTDAKNITNGVLYGNLYLVHSGDPTLTFMDLSDLMVALKARQIQQIDGNVYIDTSAYDQVDYGPGWIWDDKRYCYAAPISASIINHNCLSFSIAPAKSTGQTASIVESPRYFYSGFQNSVVTKGNSHSCSIRLGTNADSSISVTGCMPRGRYAQGVSTVISDVVQYNKALMRSLFRRSGVQVNGTIMAGAAPANLPILVTHESKPLSTLITEMLKKSDNIIAGSIFKKLGETYSKQPGSWENGSVAVTKILEQKANVNSSNMNVLDGSGLSRYNQITPAQMLQVLDYAYHNTTINHDFIFALPIAGIDGTLKHRLGNVARRVRAKTGTMTGVNALAGYAIAHNKEELAFVIIVNGHTGMGWQYKELEDRLVTDITKYQS